MSTANIINTGGLTVTEFPPLRFPCKAGLSPTLIFLCLYLGLQQLETCVLLGEGRSFMFQSQKQICCAQAHGKRKGN